MRWQQNPPPPLHRTMGEMMASRQRRNRPDRSYDVDGDGVISQSDLLLANRFDDNRDGVLDSSERAALRKQLVEDAIAAYRQLHPGVCSKATDSFVQQAQSNIEAFVRSDDFQSRLDKLKGLTELNDTENSAQMEGCLAPLVVGQRHQAIQAFRQLDADQKGVVTKADLQAVAEDLRQTGVVEQPDALIEQQLQQSQQQQRGGREEGGGIPFREWARQTQQPGPTQALAEAVTVVKPARRPWSTSVRVPALPAGESDPTSVVLPSPKKQCSGARSKSELVEARRREMARFAENKLDDLPERYKRSHLQLHPQLIFFTKEH